MTLRTEWLPATGPAFAFLICTAVSEVKGARHFPVLEHCLSVPGKKRGTGTELATTDLL